MDLLKNIISAVDADNKKVIAILMAVVILCFGIVLFNDNSVSGNTTLSTVKSQSSASDDDFASVLSNIEGAGQVSIFVTYVDAEESQVKGVIIVAEGADDIDVVLKLQSAAATAFGISIDQIEVFEMKGVSTQ